MSSLIRIYGALSFLVVGAALTLLPVAMKQDQCSDEALNSVTHGGMLLIGISLIIFIVTVATDFSEMMTRRRRR